MHFFVDYIEKIKNIIEWKNKRKTEMFLISLFLLLIAFYLMKIETMLLIYILKLIFYGKDYYKKL